MSDTHYPIGPVDPAKPLELDDGRPVRLMTHEECLEHLGRNYENAYLEGRHNSLVVWVDGPVQRDEARISTPNSTWWTYNQTTGVWGGGDPENYYVLRNVREAGKTVPALHKKKRRLCL